MSGTYVTNSMLGQMQRAVAPLYMDTCKRLVYTPATDSYAHPTYAAGVSLVCLFDSKPSDDVQPGTDVPMTDATLYLPAGTVLLPDDRVQITAIHGQSVTNPQTYRIVAGPLPDYFGVKAGLKLVTE